MSSYQVGKGSEHHNKAFNSEFSEGLGSDEFAFRFDEAC
jgi:hypothetical protein